MMKELPKKGLVMLTYICNAMLKNQFMAEQLKTAEIILIPKPEKRPKRIIFVSSNKFIDHNKQII
jgi:hypothetical protein